MAEKEPDRINMFKTIERAEINTISENGAWEESQFSFDNRVAEAVAPDIMSILIPTIPGAPSRKGVEYEAAHGPANHSK